MSSFNLQNLTNSPSSIFLPAAFLAIWSVLVIGRLAAMRVAAVNSKKVHPNYYKLHFDKESAAKGKGPGGEPIEVAQVSQHVENLFETPQLFYAVVCVLFLLNDKNVFTVYAAWAYFGARLIHSFVSLTSNFVPYRFGSFGASLAIVCGLWIRVCFLVLSA